MGGEHTFADVDAAAGVVEAMVRDLDVATLSGAAATRLVERLVVCERVVAAARSRAAARAVDANQWRHAGQRDEAVFVAGLTGTTTGAAAAELATTRRLAGLTATRAARDAGALSDLAAREVASAATVDPGAEQALLEHATRDDAAR